MMAGGPALWFKRFSTAIRPPNVPEFAHEAISSVALGATALAYSASTMASRSSPFAPGSVQLFVPLGGAGWIGVSEPSVYAESPKIDRNEVQSSAV